MRFALLGLLVVSTSAHAQLAQPTPAAVFSSARSRLLADMSRQPRYTCVQNITRQMFRVSSSVEKRSCSAIIAAFETRKHDPPLTSWDRLRLDVAIADNREIHAWPDAPRFSDDEVRRFAGGPFGTGDFGIFIGGIFGGSAAVKFQGEHALDGRTLFDYNFEVSAQASRYQIEAGSARITTAYGGSFALDPQTADIVELTVRTAELPENTPVGCQARNQIEYGRLDINGHQVLIPRETRLRVIDRDGKEGLNTITYSSCHEYTSKSSLRFDNPEPSAGAVAPHLADSAAPTPRVSPFPSGVPFDCRMMTPLDSDTAAAGSSMEAILRTPIHGKNGTVLAPRGARIHARLVRFAQYTQALDYFEVGVRLESIEINGAELPLYATLAEQEPMPVRPPTPAQLREGFQGDLPAPLPPEVGAFFFVREHLQLHQFDSAWVTTAPEPDTKPVTAAANSAVHAQ